MTIARPGALEVEYVIFSPTGTEHMSNSVRIHSRWRAAATFAVASSVVAGTFVAAAPAQAAKPVPAPTGSYSYTSDPYEYIGQGGSGSYAGPTYEFGMTSGSNAVNISVSSDNWPVWSIALEADDGEQLTLGRTYRDHGDPDSARVWVESNERVCSSDSLTMGTFTVTALQKDRRTGEITEFAADFEQHCDEAYEALRGSVHFTRG
ncbi:hypothetical protein [Streptomyces sp. NPDC055287]